jgi:hypothetical protein
MFTLGWGFQLSLGFTKHLIRVDGIRPGMLFIRFPTKFQPFRSLLQDCYKPRVRPPLPSMLILVPFWHRESLARIHQDIRIGSIASRTQNWDFVSGGDLGVYVLFSIAEQSAVKSANDNNMGKRDAVRNNSGLSVDHSDPDLGVGPTNPATSGRNPEACPPISESIKNAGTGESDGRKKVRREALDRSQGKSGGARARASLRSEAEQRRTSFESDKHDSWTHDLADPHDISSLINFFKLLDRWDRERKYKC